MQVTRLRTADETHQDEAVSTINGTASTFSMVGELLVLTLYPLDIAPPEDIVCALYTLVPRPHRLLNN
jgi:hypothetical protein